MICRAACEVSPVGSHGGDCPNDVWMTLITDGPGKLLSSVSYSCSAWHGSCEGLTYTGKSFSQISQFVIIQKSNILYQIVSIAGVRSIFSKDITHIRELQPPAKDPLLKYTLKLSVMTKRITGERQRNNYWTKKTEESAAGLLLRKCLKLCNPQQWCYRVLFCILYVSWCLCSCTFGIDYLTETPIKKKPLFLSLLK